MTPALLALGASAVWGASDTLGGLASRGRPVLSVMLLTRAASVLLVGVLVLVLHPAPVGADWPFAVVAAGVNLTGLGLLYRALAIGPMSVVAPIAATSAVVPVVWGSLSGERPGTPTLLALTVTVAGCVLTARAPGGPGMAVSRAGVVSAVGAALGMGAALTLLDRASQASAVGAVALERSSQLVLLLLLAALLWRRVGPGLARPGAVPLVGLLDTTAILLYATATTGGLLPVVAVLASLYPVGTVLLARLVLHERMSRWQGVGAVVTLVAVGAVVATAS
ncbi:EamA family transporter [Desertihabitans aurantiacus]|uniref:EamA family transporter n=1 Tax=Desertihabitans aurantiacus TaxID=2282477 RepID=UPI0013006AEC